MKPGRQQRLVGMDDERDVDDPARHEPREELRKPHDQPRQPDGENSPKYRQVVELLPVGPPVKLRPRSVAEEPFLVRDKIPPVLQCDQHRVGTEHDLQRPFQLELAGLRVAETGPLRPDRVQQLDHVQRKTDEQDERRKVMERPRHRRPAQEVENALGPVRVIEFQRHPGHDQQQETGHEHEVQHPLERQEPREPFVVGLRADFGFAERFRVVAIQVAGTEKPEHGVHPEHAKRPDQQRGHHHKRQVQRRIMCRVQRIGVRDVPGKTDGCLGVTLPAGLHDVRGRQTRLRIGGRQDVVIPVTIVTGGHLGCHVRISQCHRLAVVGLTIVGEPVFMTSAAPLIAHQFLEIPPLGRLDLVRRVAITADRGARVARGEQLAVDAALVHLFHTDMTLPARLGDVGMIDWRTAVNRPLDGVDAVAIIAGRRDDQPHF